MEVFGKVVVPLFRLVVELTLHGLVLRAQHVAVHLDPRCVCHFCDHSVDITLVAVSFFHQIVEAHWVEAVPPVSQMCEQSDWARRSVAAYFLRAASHFLLKGFGRVCSSCTTSCVLMPQVVTELQ